MADRKLNKELRTILLGYSEKLVSRPEYEAEQEARFGISRRLNEWAAAEYPQNEMAVLAKHNCAKEFTYVHLLFGKRSSIYGFTLLHEFKDTTMPCLLVPALRNSEVYYRGAEDDPLLPVCEEWQRCSADSATATKQLRAAYREVITKCKTTHELFQFWPQAEDLLIARDPVVKGPSLDAIRVIDRYSSETLALPGA
jgi:hypothetical protein